MFSVSILNESFLCEGFLISSVLVQSSPINSKRSYEWFPWKKKIDMREKCVYCKLNFYLPKAFHTFLTPISVLSILLKQLCIENFIIIQIFIIKNYFKYRFIFSKILTKIFSSSWKVSTKISTIKDSPVFSVLEWWAELFLILRSKSLKHLM